MVERREKMMLKIKKFTDHSNWSSEISKTKMLFQSGHPFLKTSLLKSFQKPCCLAMKIQESEVMIIFSQSETVFIQCICSRLWWLMNKLIMVSGYLKILNMCVFKTGKTHN